MLFNTLTYGGFFLAVFAVHWLLPQRARRPFLLIASYYFYASAIPQYLLLILALTAANYGFGLWLSRAAGRTKRLALWLGIASNLACLGFFKYSGLLASSAVNIARHLPGILQPIQDPIVVNVVLPLGISFFTFEFIHYLAEVYKGLRPMKHPIDFALFAAFFPTQIAGPIKRFPDFAKQLLHPQRFREVDFDAGIGLILRGLLKKILLADVLSPLVAVAFAQPGALGPAAAWFAVFAFAAQIYGDFSGYTDIGRGSALLLGYWVPQNFDRPYQSATPAEFWHRWHMSLSTWLRDYLYIPLGGSRVARWRVYVNLMITMALGGLWHGASWHFMVWGVYQGVLLCGHRLWSRTVGRIPLYAGAMGTIPGQFVSRAVTLVLVCAGWVIFRAPSVGASLHMFRSMVAIHRPAWAGLHPATLSTPMLLMLGVTVVVVGGWVYAIARPLAGGVWERAALRMRTEWWPAAHVFFVRPAFFVAAVLLLMLWPSHASPRFIYFQF